MKKFWRTIGWELLAIFISLTLVVIFFPFLSANLPWLANMGIALVVILGSAFALLGMTLRRGGEYWIMRNEANKFHEDLEFFARVRYESGWSLGKIQLYPERFKVELEKRKLSWMRKKE